MSNCETTINLLLYVPVISSDKYKVMVLSNHFSRLLILSFISLVKRKGVVFASGRNYLLSGDR